MPVSGAAVAKGSLLQNGWVTVVSFFGPLVDFSGAIADYEGDHRTLGSAAWRVAQLAFPTAMASGFVVLIYKHFREAAWAPFIAGMCAAIIIKAGYNFIFVNYWHQASWCFAFARGTLGLTTALLLFPLLKRWRMSSPISIVFTIIVTVMICFQQASLSSSSRAVMRESGDRMAFYQARSEMDSALDNRMSGAKMIEFGNGMIAFTLGRPVRHGFVFAGDLDSSSALQAGVRIRDDRSQAR